MAVCKDNRLVLTLGCWMEIWLFYFLDVWMFSSGIEIILQSLCGGGEGRRTRT